jgi:hypothetical protein
MAQVCHAGLKVSRGKFVEVVESALAWRDTIFPENTVLF